jgi:hypothetical protein
MFREILAEGRGEQLAAAEAKSSSGREMAGFIPQDSCRTAAWQVA